MSTNISDQSRPEIHSIFDVIHNEKIRLMKKGYHFFIGLGIVLFFFCIAPQLIHPWYCMIQSHNAKLYLVIYQPLLILIQMIAFNLVIDRIYKIPYFNRYRIMKKP